MDNLISAYPDRDRSILARQSFYNTVVRSLSHLKCVAEDTIDVSSFPMDSFTSDAITTETLNPKFFFLHEMLLHSMRDGDAEQVSRYHSSIAELSASTPDDEFRAVSIPEIRSLGNSEWENFVVNEVKTSMKADTGQEPELYPISSQKDVQAQETKINEALTAIYRSFPEMGQEIEVFLHKMRLFTGRISMGITDVRMFGCMFIRVPRPEVDSVLYYIEHICHEVSHMYLNAAMTLDPIVLNDREKKFRSPIRKDPRAMIGIFHATFVTSRIVLMFTKLIEEKYSEERASYLDQQLFELRDGIIEVGRFGELSAVGKSLLEEFKAIYWWAETKSFWSNFDSQKERFHRFGGGMLFRSALPDEGIPRTQPQ